MNAERAIDVSYREDGMREKPFRLRPDEILLLAPNRGACLASDRITVDGAMVAFMYRTSPQNRSDSGWVFLAGDESQEYLDDPDNLAIFDVNTIANYDRCIIPLLDAPVGSAFEWNPEAGEFQHTLPPPAV